MVNHPKTSSERDNGVCCFCITSFVFCYCVADSFWDDESFGLFCANGIFSSPMCTEGVICLKKTSPSCHDLVWKERKHSRVLLYINTQLLVLFVILPHSLWRISSLEYFSRSFNFGSNSGDLVWRERKHTVFGDNFNTQLLVLFVIILPHSIWRTSFVRLLVHSTPVHSVVWLGGGIQPAQHVVSRRLSSFSSISAQPNQNKCMHGWMKQGYKRPRSSSSYGSISLVVGGSNVCRCGGWGSQVLWYSYSNRRIQRVLFQVQIFSSP